MMILSRKHILIFVMIALMIPLWNFSSYLFYDVQLRDIAALHFDYAEKHWFFDHLSQGTFAWIYPNADLGHSLMTNPASGLLFVPNLLYAVLPFDLVHKGMLVFFYLLFFTGMIRLLKPYADEFSVWCVALASLSTGLMSSLPVHVALGYMSVLPWAISSVRDLWSKNGSFSTSILSVASVFLLGDPVLAACAGLMGCLLGFMDEKRPKNFKALGLAVLLIVLICLPHLVMMLMDFENNSRSLGIDRFEALSYSTHPIRILDWLFPSIEIYDSKTYASSGFNNQWWFPRIGGGVVLTFLILRGVVKRSNFLILACALFFIHLALGYYSPLAKWILESIPPMSQTRFPERFIVYAFPFLMILAVKGLMELSKNWKLVLLGLALLENLAAPRVLSVIKNKDLTIDLPREQMINEEIHPTRFFMCVRGTTGTEDYAYTDVRAQGFAMVNGTSNTNSPGLKVQGCPHSLTDFSQQWLGWTHILHGGNVSSAQSGSPLQGLWVHKPKSGKMISNIPLTILDQQNIMAASQETIFIESTESLKSADCSDVKVPLSVSSDGKKISFYPPSNCTGFVTIPWAYHYGWREVNDHKIYRANSSIMAFKVDQNNGPITVQFDPPFLRILVLLSFFLQILLCTIIFKRNLKIKGRI